MSDLTSTIDTYLAGYCEPDRPRRIELLGRAWSVNSSLIDPPFDGAGIDGIADLVDGVLSQFPGHRFARTTAIDAHHNFARYGWALNAPDGTTSVAGYDLAELDEGGKLIRVVGFFGPLTELAA